MSLPFAELSGISKFFSGARALEGVDFACSQGSIHAILGDRVSLYIPSDLDERFQRYSRPALLQPLKSSDILRRVRHASHPAVQQVLRLIDHHAAGLEQEALLLS